MPINRSIQQSGKHSGTLKPALFFSRVISLWDMSALWDKTKRSMPTAAYSTKTMAVKTQLSFKAI